MPRQSWSNKRERQYEHIKEGEQERGRSSGRAEEIAARTVNKQRAESGEARSGSRGSSGGRSSSARAKQQQSDRSKEQLYAEAKRRNLKGRSKMTKAELVRALH
ncbi:plasmid stabilization protein [Dactylosporangium sp. NPDC051485]|uniref:plasmid stabilization protein n=1 Tax=Dactylosporangium sp. NPDC051485 TaxID=3154846 RepID=UPI00344019EB